MPLDVLAERASRAIAEYYESMGPGRLPWAIAERFVSGALEVAVTQERIAIVAYLQAYAALSVNFGVRVAVTELAERVATGEHARHPTV